ncbi:hypothetical protein A5893_17310 [Pedobacter psychrophilus]|uniref:Lipoprotein n=1 Tax=Pedobacter psychrophilus TaxID=1826909 RepID=A0A179DPI0_9SPHI|nr:hypothetical protein [Pedobacter psychrophilus]OAQ42814.1 hypothetical protein A5893_17310 [Pedobacter psychrophilus]
MKKLNYLCILISIIACNNNIKEEENNIVVDKKPAINNPVSSQKIDSSALYPLNGKLPFGSIYLENLDTSYGWDSPKWDNVDLLNSNILDYYRMLNKLKVISKPNILKKEYLKLKFTTPFIDSITHSIDSIRYQFENIGPYECYYAQLEDDFIKYPAGFYDEKRLCKKSGNLILYNPKTQVAKIINIFTIIQEPYDYESRNFFIGKNKEIKIFQFVGDDGGLTGFYQNYSIKILDNGEIKIKELNQ